MTNPKAAGDEGEIAQGELVDVRIDTKRRMTLPARELLRLGWNADIRAGAPSTFELVEAGRARIMPGAYLHDTLAAAHDDADALSALRGLLFRATWNSANAMTVPRLVALHVVETGELHGTIFVRAHADYLELLSEKSRLRDVAKARGIAGEYLWP